MVYKARKCVKEGWVLPAARLAKLQAGRQEGLAKLQAEGVLEELKAAKAGRILRIRESRLRIADNHRLAWGVIRGLVVPQWLRYHPDGGTTPFNLSTFPPHSSEYPNYAPLQTVIRKPSIVI